MDTLIELHAQPHPDPQVRRAGFDLTDPYVEQCWGAVIGPSGVAVMRRLPVLWAEHEPARVATSELGGMLGLVGGTGEHSRLNRALDRLTQFRLAAWLERGASLALYTEVAPLNEHRLRRLPEWTRAAHDRLLDRHLDQLAGRDDRSARVADITAHLDQLQQSRANRLPSSKALGR